MKAGILYKNGDIRYEEWPEPVTESGQVKIRVRVCGICGSDIARIWQEGAHYYPIVLGHEYAGEVVEVGEDVTSLKTGDRVAGVPLKPCMVCESCQQGRYSKCTDYSFTGSREQGAFAEYIVVPEKNAVKISDDTSFEAGAFFEPATVSLHGLFCAEFKGGSSVAVLGAGNIGILLLEWVKLYGAKQVAVFDINDERLNTAKLFGADITVNMAKVEDADEILKGERFDYVFETAGQPDTIRLGFNIVTDNGRFTCIGTPSKDITFGWELWEQINRKEFINSGTWMSYSAPFPGKEWVLTAHSFGTGELKIDESMIFRRIALKDIETAVKLLENPRQVKGKILITIDED